MKTSIGTTQCTWKHPHNIVFLDWDGVIQVKDKQNTPKKLILLKQLVNSTNSQIVLSSNRRSDIGIKKIIKYFEEIGISYHKDIIPLPSIDTDTQNRASLISQWLKQNSNCVANFVILDDNDSNLSNMFPDNYLQTLKSNGLTPSIIQQAIQILKGREGSYGEKSQSYGENSHNDSQSYGDTYQSYGENSHNDSQSYGDTYQSYGYSHSLDDSQETSLYPLFIYGTNSKTQLEKRLQLPNIQLIAGYLNNYTLQFSYNINQKTVTSVLPEKGKYVLGSLIYLSLNQLKQLDYYEGVQSGMYQREVLPVHIFDSDTKEFIPENSYIYIKTDTTQTSSKTKLCLYQIKSNLVKVWDEPSIKAYLNTLKPIIPKASRIPPRHLRL